MADDTEIDKAFRAFAANPNWQVLHPLDEERLRELRRLLKNTPIAEDEDEVFRLVAVDPKRLADTALTPFVRKAAKKITRPYR